MREIKFRAWLRNVGIMLNVYKLDQTGDAGKGTHFQTSKGYSEHGAQFVFNIDDAELMQFTGLKDKNGIEIYEGDIFRIEEPTDGLDDIFYVVITWVQEWCMFATLRIDELEAYESGGVKALDEPMFWTYTLEDTNSRKHFLCGNIYENPELLKP